MANQGIHVTGIPELTRALKDINPRAAKELKKELKAIAAEVVKGAQSRMEFGGGTAASSVKPGSGIRGAWIRHPGGGRGSGTDADGYFPWLDFGGGRVAGRGVTANRQKGVGARRSVYREGRYVWPAIAAARESGFIEEHAAEAFENAAHAGNFETRGF